MGNKEDKRASIKLTEEVDRELRQRGGLTPGVSENLARYFSLLRSARADLVRKLNGDAQALGLIVDALNGTRVYPEMLGMPVTAGDRPVGVVGAEIEDLEQACFEKWGVDRGVLLRVLSELSPLEEAALIDAAERFWRAVGVGVRVDPTRILDEPDMHPAAPYARSRG